MLKLIILNLIVPLGITLSSCSKYSSSQANGETSFSSLTLTGKTITTNGQAAVNADIFAGNINEKIGTTAADGSLKVTVTADHKRRLRAQNPNVNQFNLYVQLGPESNRLGGLSSPVSINDSGEKNLGNIVISDVTTISGSVLAKQSQGDATPEAGVTISAGPSVAYTDANGRFTLKGVPAGNLRITAQLGGYATQSIPVTAIAGQATTLNQQVIMHLEDAVIGEIVPLTDMEISGSYDQRLPYLASFNVYSPANASKIRFSHIKAELDADSLAWQPVRDVMQYNFPDAGAQLLYVQFASNDLSMRSKVTSIQINIKPFFLSSGLVIENGAERIFNRAARISVDVPPSATRMRLAQDAISLKSTPWEQAAPETNFTFSSVLDRSTNTINANGIHELFLQFSDSAGFESKVYKAITYIEIFPIEWREQIFVGPNVFTFNDGNIVSNKHLVNIDLVPPPNAVEVTIFEGIIVAGGIINPVRDTRNFWLDVNQPLSHNFEYDGAKVVYVQFRDRDHALSPVYSNFITIDPTYGFQDDQLWGFELAGQDIFCPEANPLSFGVSCLNTRWVFLELWPPETASKFAISEGNPSQGLIQEAAWRTIPYPEEGKILIPYEIGGIGRKQINVHYHNFDGRTLPAYSKEVEVVLNNSSSFQFIEVRNEDAEKYLDVDEECLSISCTRAKTNSTNIWLQFNAPRFAAKRRVFVISNGITTSKETSANEVSISIAAETTSQVYVEYLSADGVTISQTSAKNILNRSDYEPPVEVSTP